MTFEGPTFYDFKDLKTNQQSMDHLLLDNCL
jgi:hypothetical protein